MITIISKLINILHIPNDHTIIKHTIIKHNTITKHDSLNILILIIQIKLLTISFSQKESCFLLQLYKMTMKDILYFKCNT